MAMSATPVATGIVAANRSLRAFFAPLAYRWRRRIAAGTKVRKGSSAPAALMATAGQCAGLPAQYQCRCGSSGRRSIAYLRLVANQQVRAAENNANHQLDIFCDNQLTVSKPEAALGSHVNVGNINCGGICNASLLTQYLKSRLPPHQTASYFAGWTGITCNEEQFSTICTFPIASAYPRFPVASHLPPRHPKSSTLRSPTNSPIRLSLSRPRQRLGQPPRLRLDSSCNVNGNTVTLTGLAGCA